MHCDRPYRPSGRRGLVAGGLYQSPNLVIQPFYRCPFPQACLQGTVSNTTLNESGTGRELRASGHNCAQGCDPEGPTCAICAPGFVLDNIGTCTACAGRSNTATVSSGLLALVILCALVYMVVACYLLSRPALPKSKHAEVAQAISRSHTFFAAKRKTLDKRSFTAALAADMAELRLTPRERELVFSTIDSDGTGNITKQELDEYITAYGNSGGKGSKVSRAWHALRSASEKQEAARETVQEQSHIIANYAKNLPDVRVPSLKLRDFPGIKLDAAFPPALLHLELPEVRLGALPGIKVRDLLRQNIPLESILLPGMSLADYPGIQIPARFVHMKLPRLPAVKLGALPGIQLPRDPLPDGWKDVLDITLPSMRLDRFPGLHIPADLPMSIHGLALPEVRLSDMPGLDLWAIARANIPLSEVRLPPLALAEFPGLVLPQIALDLQHRLPQLPAVKLGEIPRIKLPAVERCFCWLLTSTSTFEASGSARSSSCLGFVQCASFFPQRFLPSLGPRGT